MCCSWLNAVSSVVLLISPNLHWVFYLFGHCREFFIVQVQGLMKTREQKPTNYCSCFSQDTKEAVVREFKVTRQMVTDKMPKCFSNKISDSPSEKNDRQFTSRALTSTFLRQLDLGWRGCFAQNCLGRSRKSLYSVGRRRYFSPQAQCIVGRQKWNWRYAGWTILIVCDIPEFSLLLLEPSPKHAVHSFPKHILTPFFNWMNVSTEWNALTVR